MENFEAGLLNKFTPCRPAPLPETALRVAQVHAEFLLIHPFRDGNGRMARFLADLMFLQAGHALPYYPFEGRKGKEARAQYIIAVQKSYVKDYAALSDFFRLAVERRISLSF